MTASASVKPTADMETETWIELCALDDLSKNTGVAALIAERQVAIFRLADDNIFAIDNLDPFSKAAVLARGIVGDVQGDPVVASPIYKQHFRLADGSCVEDDTVSVNSYRVRLVDGKVRVCIEHD